MAAINKKAEHINTIILILQELQERFPHVIVGGSVGLIAQNLLIRTPKDLDLITSQDCSLRHLSHSERDNSYSDYEEDSVIAGEIVTRYAYKIRGIKVCLFIVPEKFMKVKLGNFYDLPILCQDPEFIIQAKEEFSKYIKGKKHEIDIRTVKILSNS